MKKYTQESKLSLGNLKNSSKQTGVLDLKPTGIVHSIGYKQVQIGQKESTVASDFLARHHQDAMNAYYMNQSQIINQTNRNIEFIQKRQVIERKIDEINEQLKSPYIPQNQQRSLYDIKNQYEEQIEQLELKENPDIMKRIQELTSHIEKLAATLTQSEAEKQELVEHAATLQSENQNLQNVCQITAQILPELQASAEQVPLLQAQIQELQATIAMGVFGVQEPNVEPELAQELEAKLKLKGEIKGDIRMIKLGIKKGWLEDEIKELLKKTNDEKFEKIKQDILSNSDNLDDSGYDSDLAGDVMNMPDN
jgi:chromosome segregation ATPase